MTVTIKQQTNEFSHQSGYRPPYDISIDGEKLGQITSNYPSEPSVWIGTPGIISRLAFRDVPSEELVGLLAVSETTLPDKRPLGLMFHAKALHEMQNLTYDDKVTGKIFPDNLPLTRDVFNDTLVALKEVKGRLENGEQNYAETAGMLKAAANALRSKDETVRAELGKEGYDYLSAELGRTPLQVAARLDRSASDLQKADMLFKGQHKELLAQVEASPGR